MIMMIISHAFPQQGVDNRRVGYDDDDNDDNDYDDDDNDDA